MGNAADLGGIIMEHKIIGLWNNQESYLDNIAVSPDDRGFVFGDGVYEVLRVYNGQPFLLEEHLGRLEKSLNAARLPALENMKQAIISVIEKNLVKEGMVYLQVTRGSAPRVHSFHDLDLKPNVLIYAKHFAKCPSSYDAEHGIKAITLEDLRWQCCHIKSLNLMANCMAQTEAFERGAKEAILFRDNKILSEGSSSNVFIVKNSVVYTPPLSNHILPGTRRKFIIEKLKDDGILVEERVLLRSDVERAMEIFITSTIREAAPVVELDGRPVGAGQVGPMAKKARDLILKDVAKRGFVH